MKIVIVTNHSYMLYQFRRELIGELLKNHEVVLSMPFVGREEEFAAMGARCIETAVDRRGINPKTDWKLFQTYQRMMKEEKPDLVITYSIKPNIYAGFVCRQLRIPYYANVQGLGTAFEKAYLAPIVTCMYKAAFAGVKGVFFENTANADEFVKRGIMKREKQIVLPGAGINLSYYEMQDYPAEAPVHFLYLGRIMKEKGMDELFSAVKRLREEGADFFLDCVGFFEDEYKEQVEELEAQGILRFHGFQEDPRPFYQAAHCVVLPSYHEGMSNVLLEAAATGRAVITSNIPGCKEAVAHGETGVLCKVKDADSLYRAMKRFLEVSAGKRQAMGKAGRAKIEAEFAKEKVVAMTLEGLGL